MTAPTLTYGHGYLTDCTATTEDGVAWTEASGGDKTLTSTSLTVLYTDIFDITGTASAASQQTYWEFHLADADNISTSIYTKYIVRWKTSDSSAGLGAKVQLVFTSGSPSTQEIVGSSAPEFDTSWHVTSGTVTTSRTLDKIRFYAVSDSNCGSGHHVYYEFLLIAKAAFTFPSVSGEIELELPNVYADLHPPGRVGDISQYLGMTNPTINLNGKIDVSTTGWGTPYGEYLYYVWREACTDPFQWFTSDLINCKVTPRTFTLAQNAEALREWRCTLQKYDVSSGAETTWAAKQWFGL